MADKIKGFTVALEHDIESEEAKQIMDAILMLKGVSNVERLVVDHSDFIAKSRYKNELRQKLVKLLEEE